MIQLPTQAEMEQRWVDERMSHLSAYEHLQLSAAVMQRDASTLPEMINCLLTRENYRVIPNAGRYTELGRHFAEKELHFPADALEYVDMYALGQAYEDRHPGVFLGGDYYAVYPKGGHQSPYTNHPQDLPQDNGWSVRLKLASKQDPDGVWVRLPDESMVCDDDTGPGEVYFALQELLADDLSECKLLEAECILPSVGDLISQYDDIEELIQDGNDLGVVLEEQGQGMPDFMPKFLAALDFEDCQSLKQALDISQNLACYDFVKDADVAGYAKQELKSKGVEELDAPDVDHCIDYKSCGAEFLAMKGYVLTGDESGYVRRNQQEFFYDRTQPSPMEMNMS